MRRAPAAVAALLIVARAVPALSDVPPAAPSATPTEPAAAAPGGDAIAGAPAAPDPEKERCIDANESAQKLVRSGSFSAARAQLDVCLQSSCPEVVRNDCAELEKAMQATMPTVKFDVRDKKGNAVTAVKVTMDSKPLAERLDGTPIPVDPGRHSFVFESPGLPQTTKALSLSASEQRTERVDMVDMTGPILRTSGLALAGVGVLVIAYGGFLGLRAKSRYDDALEHCPRGPGSCDAVGVGGGRDAHDDASTSTTMFVVGGILGAGGAALYFFVPEEGFRVTPGTRAGGIGLEATKTW